MILEYLKEYEEIIIYIFKIFFISIFTYYTSIKILNINMSAIKLNRKVYYLFIFIIFSVICWIMNNVVKLDINSIIYMIFEVSIILSITTKSSFGYSILVNIISLSINQIIFFIATMLGYIPHLIFQIDKEIVDFVFIIFIHFIILFFCLKLRRVKNGFSFLIKRKNNEYFNLIILNISIAILFFIIFTANYKREITSKLGIGLIMFSIIMFITIQKSLQLYYKQKMLVKDLEETKAELEDKKKEVEALEKENLEFSKVSHSIAHKQKSLEHKLNELSMKSEIAEEINLKDRIDDLSKDLRKETIVVLDKTGIDEIDDMLSYMQSECVKNKIDFQLQLNGNIYKMINHYIDKEELEILLADHIKNAIIAIGYGNNINKSILVRLGKLDESYGLYVYDSGIEFEIETLINLGKKPSTTHKESGGTGMGFMNTFDTLRKHKASFIIEELGKPTKDNFTKVLKFKFDGKNEFKICSYREKEIKNKDKENSLIVEKISL